MPKFSADRVIMFCVIGLVAWGIVGAPLLYSPPAIHQPAKAEPSADGKPESDKGKPDEGLGHWLTHDAAGFFTLWLVIVGGFQIGLFYWQLRYMRTGMEDASKAADASVTQAKIARETQTNLQRPYIFVFDVARLRRHQDGGWCLLYTVANYGSIPAIVDDVSLGFDTSDCVEPPPPLRASDDHHLFTSPILTGGERREPTFAWLPDNLTTGGLVFRIPINEDRVFPELDLLPGHELFFRVIVQYRGPFTRGHETSAMWRVRPHLGDLVPAGGDDYNYTR